MLILSLSGLLSVNGAQVSDTSGPPGAFEFTQTPFFVLRGFMLIVQIGCAIERALGGFVTNLSTLRCDRGVSGKSRLIRLSRHVFLNFGAES